MRDYLELTKPSVTWLILMSTGVGYFFGVTTGWTWTVLLHTLLGTGLLAAGTFTLNQWYEREADAKMRRTWSRPLPLGRISARRAFWFGVALSAAGFVDLWVGTNLLTSLLGLFTLLTYLLLYTPLKQRTWHCTTIGAVPGAMPPVIGFAAAHGSVSAEGWILFAILFLWQFPHFYSIAWMYREDYSRAGIQMLPVIEPDVRSTVRQILGTSLILIPVSAAPSLLSMAGSWYLLGAITMGGYFFYTGVRLSRERSNVWARNVLLASVVYLPLLYGLMLVDRPRM
jgi:protoheme IX farnesyltransferase